ncbi:MAG TPA: MATE family efflux transporter [Longimicrobiaceae bacterium]|nr:MATE family efflux transporter [Longimicrobiaceae bacterium]
MPGRRRRGVLLAHEARTLLKLAGPIILSQLGQVGMNMLDTIMVGPLGANSLAAVGLAGALHNAVLLICTGTLLGMGPLVSQAFGAGERLECRRTLVNGLWLGVLLCVPVIWVNWIGEPLALALGQDPEVAAIVGGYLRALAWGVPPVVLFFAIRQFLEGMGLTRPAMLLTFLGLVLNYFGNRAFIYGVGDTIPAMGAVGSGWATTLVRWGMLLGMVAYLLWNPKLHPFRGIRRFPDAERLRAIAKIGTPAGVVLGLEVGVFSFAAVMMGWIGPIALAAHQVTLNIAATTFMVALGVSLAGAVRVGHHIGAGNAAGVRRAVAVTYALALGFMGVCALIFLTAPRMLLGIYTSDPAILGLGSSLLFFAAVFQLFDGAQVAGVCTLRGAADTRVPMVLAALGYWGVGVPAALWLGFRTPLGPVGVWSGLCLALGAAALLLALRVRKVLWTGTARLRPAVAHETQAPAVA